jgi:hypothetical protein
VVQRMALKYTYLLIHPKRPGMLAVLGAFHYKYQAEQFIRRNYTLLEIQEMQLQLWRVKGDVANNIMRCSLISNLTPGSS